MIGYFSKFSGTIFQTFQAPKGPNFLKDSFESMKLLQEVQRKSAGAVDSGCGFLATYTCM